MDLLCEGEGRLRCFFGLFCIALVGSLKGSSSSPEFPALNLIFQGTRSDLPGDHKDCHKAQQSGLEPYFVLYLLFFQVIAKCYQEALLPSDIRA